MFAADFGREFFIDGDQGRVETLGKGEVDAILEGMLELDRKGEGASEVGFFGEQ